MIRFFGIILGVVLIANIVVTAHTNNYNLSSLTTMGREVVRMVSETINKLSEKIILTQQNSNGEPLDTADNTATVADSADMTSALLEVQPALPEQLVESPSEVRIFWGPFHTRAAARGFANTAEAIGGLPTEVIEQGMGKRYIAFVGQPEAIDSALAAFAERTGMHMEQQYAL